MESGVNVDSHHLTPITRFPEERNLPEWVISICAHGRTTSVYRFPFPFEETAETPESFPDIDMNVLSFSGLRSPQRCHGNGLGSQADPGHRAEPMRAGNDRILAVEAEFASAICGC